MAILILIALYGSYFKFFFYLRSNRDNLSKPSVKASHGILYDGLRPFSRYDRYKEINYIEFYSFVFFLRRAVYVALTFALIKYPGL